MFCQVYDYKSFCLFLTQRQHISTADTIDAIQLLRNINTKTTQTEIKERIIAEIIQNKAQYAFDSVEDYDSNTDRAFDKVLEELYGKASQEINDIREEAKKKNDNLIYYATREEIIADSSSIGAIISYLGIYIGGVFLIVSAAVLALQQLSESTDNISRYNLLKKIGVDEGIINKSLLTQIAIYFLMPLSLALIHSIAGLEYSKRIVTLFGSINIMKNILIALAVLVIIYGGYFVATYLGAKKNINNAV